MRISDWSSDVCSSDLCAGHGVEIDERISRRLIFLVGQILAENPEAPAIVGCGVDDARIPQRETLLVDIGVGNLELIGLAAVRQSRAEAEVAVTDRGRISEVGASGPCRRVLNLRSEEQTSEIQ